MKRINLSVNVEDSEVLTQSITEALQAQAKQIAREAFNTVLEDEVERIADYRIKDLKENSYYNSVKSQIVTRVAEQVTKDIKIDPTMVDDLIQLKVDTYMNRKIEQRGGMDTFIQDYLDRSIAAALTERSRKDN